MNMPKVTIIFGALLFLLGVVGYFVTGQESWTALIPSFFGLVLIICGALAHKESRKKHFMHLAAALGLFGFIGSARGLGGFFTLIGGGEVARPGAVISQTIMAILSLIFVLLCVKSFIDARKNRQI